MTGDAGSPVPSGAHCVPSRSDEMNAPTSVPTMTWSPRRITALAGESGRSPVMSVKCWPASVERKTWPAPTLSGSSPRDPGGAQCRP